jgi:RNA polymerase-binding transcription factor DksA
MTKVRRVELGQLLGERRRQIVQQVQNRVRERRVDRLAEVVDIGETVEGSTQEDLEFALLQNTSEALERIDEALHRIEAGEYGHCLACRLEISEQRLRALPFAVRCTTCQERHEQSAERARRARDHEAAPTFGRIEGSAY